MNQSQSLSHTRWDCQYHVVFLPKPRKQKLWGTLRKPLGESFHELATHQESKIVEGPFRPDHVPMWLSLPPKSAVANVVAAIQGKSAMAIARRCRGPERHFTGEVFWARGYWVSTVGLDEAMGRASLRRLEPEDERYDQMT